MTQATHDEAKVEGMRAVPDPDAVVCSAGRHSRQVVWPRIGSLWSGTVPPSTRSSPLEGDDDCTVVRRGGARVGHGSGAAVGKLRC